LKNLDPGLGARFRRMNHNNDLMLRQSRYFAERIENEAGESATEQVNHALQRSFGRLPSEQEQPLAVSIVEQHGLFALSRSLLNSNEFVYVD